MNFPHGKLRRRKYIAPLTWVAAIDKPGVSFLVIRQKSVYRFRHRLHGYFDLLGVHRGARSERRQDQPRRAPRQSLPLGLRHPDR